MGAALDLETGVEEQLTALARLIVKSRLAEFCGVALVGDDGRLRTAGLAGPDAETEDVLAAVDPNGGLASTAVATGRSVLAAQLPDDHLNARRRRLRSPWGRRWPSR